MSSKTEQLKNRIVGEHNFNNFGSKIEITDCRKYSDIDVYFEDYNWTYYNTNYNSFKNGELKCPYEKRVFNKGYLGEGNFKVKEDNIITKEYNHWHEMIKRCYSDNFHIKNPTYIDCETIEEWHNFQNFGKWMDNNYYEIDGELMCLDKDILHKGNKIYSPENCIFVPKRINNLFIKSDKARGNYPIGCTYHKRDNKIDVWCNTIEKRIYLGRFNPNQIEEAFQTYKEFKERYIKEVADEYRHYIPNKLYEALYDYKVEITD